LSGNNFVNVTYFNLNATVFPFTVKEASSSQPPYTAGEIL
jgi:hypothetical protein